MGIKDRECISKSIAASIYGWLIEQKVGQEGILHAAVVCDFVGSERFKIALTNVVGEALERASLERVERLENLLRHAQEDTCSMRCPSEWKTTEGRPPHSDLCREISDALQAPPTLIPISNTNCVTKAANIPVSD